MLLKARHLRHLPVHLARIPRYIRGYRGFRAHIKRYGAKPRVAVVGAAGDGLGKWRPWAMWGFVEGVGFEPDQAECGRLRRAFPFITLHPIALGHRTGPADFYITSGAWCCSCLPPDQERLAPYSVSRYFKVEKVTQVPLRRFDELCSEGVVRAPHFLQVDVQGFEHQVLEGFGKCLDEVLAITCESHFVPIYKGEKTLWEIIEFLKERGFVLRHLSPAGLFGGELVEVDAFFVRLLDPHEEEERSLIRLWELVYNLPRPSEAREGLA